MAKLVGYRRFTSKKNGKDYCSADVVSNYSKREIDSGAFGQKAEQVFMPSDQLDFLKPEHIGREIVLDYELSGNRAYLVNVSIK